MESKEVLSHGPVFPPRESGLTPEQKKTNFSESYEDGLAYGKLLHKHIWGPAADEAEDVKKNRLDRLEELYKKYTGETVTYAEVQSFDLGFYESFNESPSDESEEESGE